jgi:HEPN domain-containing protein
MANKSSRDQTHYPLDAYFSAEGEPPIFRLTASAQFSPLDINIAFLTQSGWNQAVDRLRFHTASALGPADHPLAAALQKVTPSALIRRLDREEDRFVSVHMSAKGEIVILSNDDYYAWLFFEGVFIDCPPSFHTNAEFEIAEEWITDHQTRAYFVGMLSGAHGWDPSHNIPDNIRQSLDEARKSLEIANYRSSVVMSRRALEAVLKFGFQRLLKRPPVNKKGHSLMLNDMITELRKEPAKPIPDHLLHIADSVRLIGNVPGAHAADLPNYQFTRSDAEYALYAVSHFLDQYFSKVDAEVTQYYELTIDLGDKVGDV